jgi:hypothetical protein
MIVAAGLAGSPAAALARSASPVGTRPAHSFAAPGLSELRPIPRVPAKPAIKIGDSSELDGVFCTSAANCWAVGFFVHSGATQNLIMAWNGSKWSRVSAPSPGGTSSGSKSEIFSVRCTSASNCWSAGYYVKHNAELSDALHWNGKKWSQIATPNPGGLVLGDVSDLDDVACSAPSDCWADGSYGTQGDGAQEILLNFVLHWNGKNWSQVSAPNPAGTTPGDINGIYAIRCTSPGDCWAVGIGGKIKHTFRLLNEILHWNGKKWTAYPAPNHATAKEYENALEGLSCTGPANCWAAGVTTGKDALLNETLHWNGHQWQNVNVPSPHGSSALSAISCTSASDCWAIGSSENKSGASLNEALHWNGHRWFAITTPQPGGTGSGDTSELASIRCTSTSNCWAVGRDHADGKQEQGQILRWNGAKWVAG